MNKMFFWAGLLLFAVTLPILAAEASLDVVSPESQGMSSERLARIEGVWKKEIANKSFAGAVTLFSRNGKVVYFKTVGTADSAQTKPMPADAIFCVASLTKPIVSIATMMLVEQGVIKLSDPIGKYIKEFNGAKMQVEIVKKGADGKEVSEFVPANKEITVYDLLRHTSGFAGTDNATPVAKKAYLDQNITAASGPISADEMLARLVKIPLCYQPGTTFRYGISTDVLGLLLERVVGKSLEDLLQEMVLRPLNMKDTSFDVPPEKLSRVPEFFSTEPGLKARLEYIARNGRDGKTYYKGAGGINSTVPDYYRFAIFMLNKGELDGVRLLSPKTIEMMTSDHLMDTTTPDHTVILEGPGYGFGLGFGVRKAAGGAWFAGTKGDYNWGGAHGHYFFVDPEEKFVGVFMSYGSWNRGHVRQVYKNLGYAAIMKTE